MSHDLVSQTRTYTLRLNPKKRGFSRSEKVLGLIPAQGLSMCRQLPPWWLWITRLGWLWPDPHVPCPGCSDDCTAGGPALNCYGKLESFTFIWRDVIPKNSFAETLAQWVPLPTFEHKKKSILVTISAQGAIEEPSLAREWRSVLMDSFILLLMLYRTRREILHQIVSTLVSNNKQDGASDLEEEAVGGQVVSPLILHLKPRTFLLWCTAAWAIFSI